MCTFHGRKRKANFVSRSGSWEKQSRRACPLDILAILCVVVSGPQPCFSSPWIPTAPAPQVGPASVLPPAKAEIASAPPAGRAAVSVAAWATTCVSELHLQKGLACSRCAWRRGDPAPQCKQNNMYKPVVKKKKTSWHVCYISFFLSYKIQRMIIKVVGFKKSSHKGSCQKAEFTLSKLGCWSDTFCKSWL